MRITTTLTVTVIGLAWGGFTTAQEASVTVQAGVTETAAKALADALKAKAHGQIAGQAVGFGDLQSVTDVEISQSAETVETFDLARGQKTVTTVYAETLVEFEDEDSKDTYDRINFPEMYADEAEEEEA